MLKVTFMGAGSTVFARNVIGDCMCSPVLREAEFALYDIDGKRLSESAEILGAMNDTLGGHGKITTYLGVENRKEALRGASFVVNAIQVGLYDPCTIIDFEVPKKVRPAPDHWRYPGDWWYYAGSAHYSSYGRFCQGYADGLSRRLVPELYQPHGHAFWLYAALYRD